MYRLGYDTGGHDVRNGGEMQVALPLGLFMNIFPIAARLAC